MSRRIPTDSMAVHVEVLERGFLIKFPGQSIGEVGDRYAAVSHDDLRNALREQVSIRVEQILTDLTTPTTENQKD